VAVGNSAEHLLEGGHVAVAIAPVDVEESLGAGGVGQIVAIADGEGAARATAESLAGALGATVAPVVNDHTDLIVFDSRPEVEPGRVGLSSSAAHLIETATSPVLVLPRGVALTFGRTTAATAA
jgi:hypothetical protein